MSQSDYLKYKKTARILSDASGIPSILTSDNYISYKQFALGNLIENTKPNYDQLVPTGDRVLFGIQRSDASYCPTFIVCMDTDKRSNRTPVTTFYDSTTGLPFVTPVVSYVKQPSYKKTACYCILDSSYTDANICKCKKSFY